MTKTQTVDNTTENKGVNIKTFRSSIEVETLYRFIHENNLRGEAQTLINFAVKKLTPPKKRGRKKKLQ